MMRVVACLLLVAACNKPATDDPDLATYLTRVSRLDAAARAEVVAGWRLTRAEFEKLVVVPFQSQWFQYATHFDELAPALAAQLDHPGTITARKHVAGDRALTPSQGRLRWVVPIQYPSMVAGLAGAPIDTVFVRVAGHWRSLSGLDEEVLSRARSLDPTCGDRLATAGPPTKCTEIAWVVADAAMRGQTDRFAHACKLAAASCPLHGLAELDAALRDAGIAREQGSAGTPTLKSAACTTPDYVITGSYGQRVTIHDHGCHICMLAPDGDGSPLLDGFARALRESPRELLAAAGLQRIDLCRTIAQENDATTSDLAIGGTIDPQRGGLMLSIENLSLTGEEIFHHELFHLLDRSVPMLRYAPDDPEWEAINPKGFSYGRGQATHPGFLDAQATKNVREDHAATYQYMMGHSAELCERAAHDPIILAKARLIRDRIRTVLGTSDYLDRRLPCL